MCFVIDGKAKAPRQRIVYKAVYLDCDGAVLSPWHFNVKWRQGQTKQIHKKAQVFVEDYWSERKRIKAHEGFYVALRVSELEKAVGDSPLVAILALEVDPKDWIATSNKKGAQAWRGADRKVKSATYRKVTVAKHQPYIQWF